MYNCLEPIVLASGSPRRKEFFDNLGFNYLIDVASIEESVHFGEMPFDFVSRMALEKAECIAEKRVTSWVIAADTIVCLDGNILGKPKSDDDAVAMLCELSGKEHSVLTSFCLMNKSKAVKMVDVVETRVLFTPFSKNVAVSYVMTGEPLDKAGSYGIQGLGGSLVERIDGSYSNVIGLPLAELISCLKKYNIISH